MTEKELSQDIGKLLGATESLARAIEAGRNELKETDRQVGKNGERLAAFQMQVDQLITQIKELRQTVVQGNGQPSLSSQVTQLNSAVATLAQRLDSLEESHSKQEEAKVLSRGQVIVAILSLIGIGLTAAIALVTALMS